MSKLFVTLFAPGSYQGARMLHRVTQPPHVAGPLCLAESRVEITAC
jgi:hypothetical protein